MLRLNRRQLTGSILAGAAMAASPSPAAAQAPAPPDSPEQLLASAKRNLESNRATLAKFKLPMAVEPAASFKAL